MDKHEINSEKDTQRAITSESSSDTQSSQQTSSSFVDSSKESIEAQKLRSLADNSDETVEMLEWQNKVDSSATENTTGIPDNIKKGIESLSGISLNDVKVHYNSSKPAEINAHAYTEGNDVYIAPGQEDYLPHELWHIVQQKDNRVKPTTEVNGKKVNNEENLEEEADKKGKQAVDLSSHLQGMDVSPPVQQESTVPNPLQRMQIVQRKEITSEDEAFTKLTAFNSKPKDAESVAQYVDRFKVWLLTTPTKDTLKDEIEVALNQKIKIMKTPEALQKLFAKMKNVPIKDAETGNLSTYIFMNDPFGILFSEHHYLTEEAQTAIDSITFVDSSSSDLDNWMFKNAAFDLPRNAIQTYKTSLQQTKKVLTEEGEARIINSIQGQIGDNISSNMDQVNIRKPQQKDDPFQYPRVPYKNQGMLDAGLGKGNGYLDPTYWKPVQYSSFALKSGVKPSEAMEAAFKGPTRLECLSTIRAVLAKSLLDLLGSDEFDKHFAYKTDQDPGVVLGTNTQLFDRVAYLMEAPNVTKVDELMKGDWIYYKNDPRYLQKHPAGLWQGENCVYDGNNKFSGFGLNGMTEQHLKTSMERAFNEDPSPRDIQRDPKLDVNHPNKKAIASAKDAKPDGFLFNITRRFDLKKYLL